MNLKKILYSTLIVASSIGFTLGVTSCKKIDEPLKDSIRKKETVQMTTEAKINIIKKYADDFVDTDKPNALYLIPKEDDLGAYTSKESIEFYNNLKKNYDTKIKIISRRRELYDAILNTPNIDLLGIGGHGDGFSATFGTFPLKQFSELNDIFTNYSFNKNLEKILNNDPIIRKEGFREDSIRNAKINQLKKKIDTELDEIYLSQKNSETKKYLELLNPNATIFLDACSGGKYSFADSIKKWAGPNRTVFAATDEYSAKDIHVNSYYPFDIKITKPEHLTSGALIRRDITYKK
ncbi:hypothetical protein COV13_02610 [Candidatus Woesearchaeota archaeon CG10_big_fil_rev_8_21_14_0_10_32_9]|nr:MAG: hypothetical protein COV13_02610 [Candidatus Woesearchaeota archaeon CG10_big_fil_rev_8_21_14_0_10_32_9]